MDTQEFVSAARHRLFTAPVIIGLIGVLVVGGLAFVGIARATDQPGFCGSACHEMGPFHDAWSKGPHKDIACVECHVDAGEVARMEHKLVAMQELATHITGNPTFPLSQPAAVPNERCVRCHPDVKVDIPGFSHADHTKRGQCVTCHSDVGHSVTTAALQQAGILNTETTRTMDASKTAVINSGQADLVGHVAVPCSRCHDMAATPCSACHKPKHVNNVDRGTQCTTCHATGAKFVFTHPVRTDCGTCHTPKDATKHTWTQACTTCHLGAPGTSFAFTHPSSTNCESCHARPANHKTGSCTTCHQNRGVNWAFTHPSSTNCESCHARPANHKTGSCTTCHHNAGSSWAFSHPSSTNCESCHARPAKHKSGSCTTCHHNAGSSWAFKHPANGANCASCHARPANHNGASCTTCHRVGKTWTFSHPGAGANCASCHPRPANHNGGSCQSCHRPGTKWVFTHPSSSSCASCHSAPGGHYGTTCQSCHSPSRPWASATFTHPSIPGGKHNYKSFACTKCHPSTGKGPGHFCSCHGNTTGPSD